MAAPQAFKVQRGGRRGAENAEGLVVLCDLRASSASSALRLNACGALLLSD